MSKLVTQKELQIEHEQKAGAYYREKVIEKLNSCEFVSFCQLTFDYY